jgi:transcriptional regulator with XRE-family HTH domain
MSTDLDTKVRELLESKRGDWQRIAEEAKVSHSWISQFVRNLIPNPGFTTLKKLHDVLSPRESRDAAAVELVTADHPAPKPAPEPQAQ